MRKTAAVFVHGLFSSTSTWEPLVRLLRSDTGVTEAVDIRLFGYPSGKLRFSMLRRIPDINTLASSLMTYLDDNLADHERVVLIGHSMGGLIIQRYLAKMLADGRGLDLRRVRRVVLLACPNSGSQTLLSIRQVAKFWPHPQERELRPLTDTVTGAQARVLNSIVYASGAAQDRCPIPITAYAGESDNVVPPTSARSVFPLGGVLPGNHFTIHVPSSTKDRRFVTIKKNILDAMNEPVPKVAKPRQEAIIALDDVYTELVTFAPIQIAFGNRGQVSFVVHAGPIDQVQDIDIVVSSENIYYEMAKPYKPSTSGRLRRAGAEKNAAGEIVNDIIFDELNAWMRAHGRHGLPVAPGTVASTSSGELQRQGITRIYHAAIVTPRFGTNEYDVDPQTLSLAVHNVFQIARQERIVGADHTSICFPLFGAGRGKLDPEVSFDWMWRALESELLLDPAWSIHFCTWKRDETSSLLDMLRRRQQVAR